MGINATCWHRVKVYFTGIKSLLSLVTVPNMNKINRFFSEISKKTLLKFGTEPNTILHASATRGTWYYTKYEQNEHFVWDITTNTHNVWKNGHNYSNLQWCQILFYMHEQPWVHVPDHGTHQGGGVERGLLVFE